MIPAFALPRDGTAALSTASDRAARTCSSPWLSRLTPPSCRNSRRPVHMVDGLLCGRGDKQPCLSQLEEGTSKAACPHDRISCIAVTRLQRHCYCGCATPRAARPFSDRG